SALEAGRDSPEASTRALVRHAWPWRPDRSEEAPGLRVVLDRRVDVVCVGILVADVIARPVDELPVPGSLDLVGDIALHGGGCALNSSSALVKLGLAAGVVGKVGADPFGDFLLELL